MGSTPTETLGRENSGLPILPRFCFGEQGGPLESGLGRAQEPPARRNRLRAGKPPVILIAAKYLVRNCHATDILRYAQDDDALPALQRLHAASFVL